MPDGIVSGPASIRISAMPSIKVRDDGLLEVRESAAGAIRYFRVNQVTVGDKTIDRSSLSREQLGNILPAFRSILEKSHLSMSDMGPMTIIAQGQPDIVIKAGNRDIAHVSAKESSQAVAKLNDLFQSAVISGVTGTEALAIPGEVSPLVPVPITERGDPLVSISVSIEEVEGHVPNDQARYVRIKADLQSLMLRDSESTRAYVKKILEQRHVNPLDKAGLYDERVLADVLHEKGNEDLHYLLTHLDEVLPWDPDQLRPGGKVEEIDVKAVILRHRPLIPREISTTLQVNGHDIALRQSQVFVRGTSKALCPKEGYPKEGLQLSMQQLGTEHLEENASLASELDKLTNRGRLEGLREEVEPNLSNLGAVLTHWDEVGPDGIKVRKQKVSSIRSGKPDTPQRMLQQVVFACSLQMQCGDEARGFRTVEKNGVKEVHFQHAIASYLDVAWIKSLGSEAEPPMFDAVWKAANDWPAEGIRWTVTDDNGNALYTIVLDRPLITQQPMSGVAGFSMMGHTKTRKINWIDNQRLAHQAFERFRRLENLALTPEQQEQLRELDRQREDVRQGLKAQGIDFNEDLVLVSPSYMELLSTRNFDGKTAAMSALQLKYFDFFKSIMVAHPIHNKELPGIEALRIALTGTYKTANDKAAVPHAGDMEMMRWRARQYANISSAVTCKSGTDRTIYGVAFATALDAFKIAHAGEEYQVRFDMDFDDLSAHDQEFIGYFNKALREFGVSITTTTKGFWGLAWQGLLDQKIAYKYFPRATEGREDGMVENTRLGGHYRGKLVQGRVILGAGRHGKVDKLSTVFSGKVSQVRERTKAAEQGVKACLLLECGVIVNDGMKLATHVETLNDTYGKDSKKKIDRLRGMLAAIESPTAVETIEKWWMAAGAKQSDWALVSKDPGALRNFFREVIGEVVMLYDRCQRLNDIDVQPIIAPPRTLPPAFS